MLNHLISNSFLLIMNDSEYYLSFAPSWIPERIRWHHARLLATRIEFLSDWKVEYNSYQINEPQEKNPLQPVYSRLIDNVIAGNAVDHKLEA